MKKILIVVTWMFFSLMVVSCSISPSVTYLPETPCVKVEGVDGKYHDFYIANDSIVRNDNWKYLKFVHGVSFYNYGKNYGLFQENGHILTHPVFSEYEYCKKGSSIQPLIPVKCDGKWGVIDTTGQFVLSLAFTNDEALQFCETVGKNYCNYYVETFGRKGKTGLSDRDGTVIIKPGDYFIENFNDKKYGLLKVLLLNSDDYIFFNRNGKKIKPREQGDEIVLFRPDVSKIKHGDCFGLIDNEGKVVVEPIFDKIEMMGNDGDNGLILMQGKRKLGIFSEEKMRLIAQPEFDRIDYYDDSIIVVVKDGFSGVINKNGRVIISPKYDSLFPVYKTYVYAMKNGKWGMVDVKEHQVVDFVYDGVPLFVGSMDDSQYVRKNLVAFYQGDSVVYVKANGECIWESAIDAYKEDIIQYNKTRESAGRMDGCKGYVAPWTNHRVRQGTEYWIGGGFSFNFQRIFTPFLGGRFGFFNPEHKCNLEFGVGYNFSNNLDSTWKLDSRWFFSAGYIFNRNISAGCAFYRFTYSETINGGDVLNGAVFSPYIELKTWFTQRSGFLISAYYDISTQTKVELSGFRFGWGYIFAF